MTSEIDHLLETAARPLKVVPIIAPVHSDAEIEAAIDALGGEPGGGLVSLPDIFTVAHRAQIISAAARNKVPAVYIGSDFVRDAWPAKGGGVAILGGRRFGYLISSARRDLCGGRGAIHVPTATMTKRACHIR